MKRTIKADNVKVMKVMGFRVNKKMANMISKVCAEEGMSATEFVNHAFNDYFTVKEAK